MEEEKKEDIVQQPETAEAVEENKTEATASDLEAKNESTGKKSKPLNKKFLAVLVLIVAVLVIYSAYTHGKFDKMLGKPEPLTVQEAENFVNTNLMQGGAGAKVSEVTEENGLWKIKLTVSDQEYTAYLTKDKKTFFPQAISIPELQQQKIQAEADAKAAKEKELSELTKNDKPTVELFVMSHCPYGTQMEKGILPVVQALGNKIDFKVKFCDYSMHNDADKNDAKELTEEMNQYCIMQNQPDKYLSYLGCFLGNGDGAKCISQTGIDTAGLNSCVALTDGKYKITAGLKDKATWKNGTYPAFPIFQADVDKYQIAGSPSLVINGKKLSDTVTADRDAASLLKTVCAGFTNAPAECSQTLSSDIPSSGFGYSGAGSAADASASCGS